VVVENGSSRPKPLNAGARRRNTAARLAGNN